MVDFYFLLSVAINQHSLSVLDVVINLFMSISHIINPLFLSSVVII